MEIEKNQGIQIDSYVNRVHDNNKVDPSEIKSDKTAAKTDTVVILMPRNKFRRSEASWMQFPMWTK